MAKGKASDPLIELAAGETIRIPMREEQVFIKMSFSTADKMDEMWAGFEPAHISSILSNMPWSPLI